MGFIVLNVCNDLNNKYGQYYDSVHLLAPVCLYTTNIVLYHSISCERHYFLLCMYVCKFDIPQ